MQQFSKRVAIVAAAIALVAASTSFAREIGAVSKQVTGSTNLQTITLKGDTLFRFGDDKLSPEGRKALDALLKKGSLSTTTRYMIEGHTDRIGDARENGKLSLRRAESVRQYLIGKDANLKLEIAGLGDRKPVKQCSDKLAKAELVKCLAPNRRVEIEQRHV